MVGHPDIAMIAEFVAENKIVYRCKTPHGENFDGHVFSVKRNPLPQSIGSAGTRADHIYTLNGTQIVSEAWDGNLLIYLYDEKGFVLYLRRWV